MTVARSAFSSGMVATSKTGSRWTWEVPASARARRCLLPAEFFREKAAYVPLAGRNRRVLDGMVAHVQLLYLRVLEGHGLGFVQPGPPRRFQRLVVQVDDETAGGVGRQGSPSTGR
ncbi:hypothetical protein [Streptomyces shaanxiensis]